MAPVLYDQLSAVQTMALTSPISIEVAKMPIVPHLHDMRIFCTGLHPSPFTNLQPETCATGKSCTCSDFCILAHHSKSVTIQCYATHKIGCSKHSAGYTRMLQVRRGMSQFSSAFPYALISEYDMHCHAAVPSIVRQNSQILSWHSRNRRESSNRT
jgi:hypothetical protein